MIDKTRTIKIRANTYRRLKIAAAERGITMLDLLDQLVGSVAGSVAEKPSADDLQRPNQ